MLQEAGWQWLRAVAAPEKAPSSTVDCAAMFAWATLRDWQMPDAEPFVGPVMRRTIEEAVRRTEEDPPPSD